MLVARDDGEAGDAFIAHHAENLGVLDHVGAVVVAVLGAGPHGGEFGRQVLRVGAPGERAEGMAPDLPRGFRGAQAFLEPRHLFDAEIGLRRLVALRVGDFFRADAHGGGGAARIFAAGFEDVVGGFGEGAEVEPREICAVDGRGLERAVVGEDHVDVLAEPEGALDAQRIDGGEVVGLLSHAARVDVGEGLVLDFGRFEGVTRAVLSYARGLVFVPGLAGDDFQRLRGRGGIGGDDFLALIAVPREFVIVPHGHEGPAGAGVLQVGIEKEAAVQRAVVFEIGGEVEVPDLPACRIAHGAGELAAAIQAVGHVFGIADDFVDEVAEVEDEAELFGAGAARIFVDHAAVGVQRAVGDVLAAGEGEADGAVVCVCWRGERAARAAGVSGFVDEAIPVFAGGLEAGREEAAGPVCGGADFDIAARDDVGEGFVARDFDHQAVDSCAGIGRAAGPEDDAVVQRIAGGDAVRVEVATLGARGGGCVGAAWAEREGCAESGGLRQQ